MDYDIQTIFNNNFLITQFFGQNLSDYKRFGMKGHNGVDFIPTNGDSWNVQSVSNGVVIEAGFDVGGFGNFIKIKDGDKIWLYAHLSKISVNRHQGVQKGGVIGVMGNTGNSEGAHLHLGLKITDNLGNVLNNNNGYFGAIDPLPYLCEILKKAQPKPQLSKVDSIQNVIQTPPAPVFNNDYYRNIYKEKDVRLAVIDLQHRDETIAKLKTENENLQNQITENQTNFRKDFDQFSKQQDELNAKIQELEGKLTNPNLQISNENYKNEPKFVQNPVLNNENIPQNPVIAVNPEIPKIPQNQENPEIPVLPILSSQKQFWQSKKFLATILAVLVGGTAAYAKVDIAVIYAFISPFIAYLGVQGTVDYNTASATEQYLKTFLQNNSKQIN